MYRNINIEIIAFLFTMFFVGKFANNVLFSNKNNNLKYVDNRVTYGEDLNIIFPIFCDINSIYIISKIFCFSI